ncbi:hypothetical protein ACERJO_11735 [Halalkalibacter sp. AB-rgal2]|uniref:hypothetical protein n=1 Tax=Halalkalibacter sp. AB-rgal2 TaxID=3242695 RepID=UPI00359EAE73
MTKIITLDTLRAERRKGTITEVVPFSVNGEMLTLEKKIMNGEMETFELAEPAGEMMTSGSLAKFKDLMRKVVLDVELGREEVPLLYKPIYQLLSDSSMPRVLDAKWAVYGTVVFSEHIEGEEVKFGSLQAEHGPIARVLTLTAGFEFTKEMKDFNDFFSVEILNRAMGEAYNAKLNHMHLNPIISYKYKDQNKTTYQGTEEDSVWIGMWKTLNKALSDTRVKKRLGTILLASSLDKDNIEMALKGGYTINGTTYPAVSGIESVIYYDGWETQVGRKKYEYQGVEKGKAYLIRPKRGFKELLKRDLTIESTAADLSRLVESQIVGYAYRGTYAAIDENVQEISFE